VSEIEDVKAAEEENYQVSRKILGDTVSLVDDVLDLYGVLAEIASKSPLAPRDEYITSLDFLLGSRHQLTLGTLAALRGYLFEALRGCRLAIELVAFAAQVKRKPVLALVWLNAADSDVAYQAHRKKVGMRALFPAGVRALRGLGQRYDLASKLSHPSVSCRRRPRSEWSVITSRSSAAIDPSRPGPSSGRSTHTSGS